jgi:hypothetical protein
MSPAAGSASTPPSSTARRAPRASASPSPPIACAT